MKTLSYVVIAAALLAACSKAPEATAQNSGPDNAMTRYTDNLIHSETHAQDVANKANAVIAGQQMQMDQSGDQSK